jgi:hypothetical protein
MKKLYFKGENTKGRSGFGGLFLILILGVAGMFLLFALYTGSLNPFSAWEGTEADRYSDPNAMPWEEGHLYVQQMLDGYGMGGRRPPFRAQPKLEGSLRYVTDVYDDDEEPRGEVRLSIIKDGDARARWAGDFTIGSKYYTVVGEQGSGFEAGVNLFGGNIAPLKIYEDENGRDRSKLYVITEGFFGLKESGKKEKITGTAYFTAWINKDYTAEGCLWIPSFIDDKSARFDWGPVEPEAND